MRLGQRMMMIVCLFAFGIAPRAIGEEGVEVERLFDVGRARIWKLHVSPAGESVVAVVSDGKKTNVVRDGKPVGPTFVSITEVVFDPRGRRLACTGRRNDEVWNVTSGVFREGAPLDEIKGRAELLAYHPDGASLACVTRIDGETHVVVNGERVGGPYEDVKALRYLPGTGELLYAAELEKGEWALVRGGRVSKHRHSVVYEIVVSPDGKSIAFAAWKDSRRLLYRDGEIVPTGYDAVDSFAFAPDGKSIAYFATKKKGEDEEELFLVHGDQATRLEGTGGAGILFKRDGTLAAYAFEDPDWKYRVVHGGKQVGEPCTWVQDMVLGPDERTLTYCAENAEETRAVVVRNGRTMGGPYDSRSVKALFRAPDGPALAFLAKVEGKWVLVRDGKAITSRFDDVTEIVRSADGRRLVFGARQGGIVHRIRMSW